MSIVTTGYGRSAELGGRERETLTRRLLRAMLGAVHRLVLHRRLPPESELPALWFKYPPM